MNVEIVSQQTKSIDDGKLTRRKSWKILYKILHAWEINNETNSNNVVDAWDSCNELETTLDQSKESPMWSISFRVPWYVCGKWLTKARAEMLDEAVWLYDTNVKAGNCSGICLSKGGVHSTVKRRLSTIISSMAVSDFHIYSLVRDPAARGRKRSHSYRLSLDTGRNVYRNHYQAKGAQRLGHKCASTILAHWQGASPLQTTSLPTMQLFGAVRVIVVSKLKAGTGKKSQSQSDLEINIELHYEGKTKTVDPLRVTGRT